ncbi:MAG: GNAT family N-acetyltransferase [Bacteroidia bacterium]|nr:GNAT family N-acetyltransferase [Bacteroidia bacterium]NND26890.1 GNAT family N-acetyltransferase [Flavobacteriaceae bacterium]MBT8277817.1 GNAT family N-acetyltransferase [Bacteroidia bacterium]NNK61131.1 GNAT family N-acetyltransferase [Flavobacteriaceae bacterium]NNL32226.1 GNAT family N-acetyltransferase [Flavobacteriaceae bacterium]
MSTIVFKRAETNTELEQILELQRINLPASLSEAEKQTEGFVTVHHNFETLKSLNDTCAHIIAVHDHKVIGYALCMDKSFRNVIPVLKPMFDKLDTILPIDSSFMIMGQVCVDKDFRKQGVFRGLYQHMRSELKSQYDQIITEVDTSNKRSLHAHLAIGFKILYSYRSKNHDWEIVHWNLN